MNRSSKSFGKVLSFSVALCCLTTVAACGSSSKDSSTSDSQSSEASVKVDNALAKQVPAKYRDGFTVAMQTSQPPEAYLENGKAVGISAEMVRAISQLIGVPIKIDSTTFENELLGLSAGKYGFVTDTNITIARLEKYDQIAYYTVAYRFVRLSTSPPIGDSFSDLCGKTTGNQVGDVSIPVIEKYSQDECVAKGKKEITIVQSPSQATALLAMQSGQVEAVARPLDAAAYAAKQPGGEGTVIDGPLFLKGLVGASFPKGSELAPVIVSALGELVKNGTYEKIMSKYGFDSSSQLTSFELNPAPLPES